MLQGKGFNNVEVRRQKKDGSFIDISISAAPLHDAQGRVTGIMSVNADITERKLMEEKLRNSTAQLSNALVITHLGHWEYDVASDLFTFNDQFYNIFRTTVEQVGGYTMHSAEYAHRFVHPDDMNMVGEETRKAIETTDPHFNRQIEHRMLYADGTVGHITVRFFIVKDSHGRTVKTYGVNQDITERKQAEDALRESEQKYRELVENANSIILRWSPNGKITFLNEFGLKFFGYTEEEILGRHVVGTIVPEIESSGRDLRPLMDIIAADPIAFEQNINENMRRNGERVWISWTNKAVLDSEGHLLECLSIGSDITERKRAENALRESEEKYRELINFLPVSIFEIDAAGSIITYNRTALDSFRYIEEDYKEGMNALQFFAPEEWQKVQENMGTVILGTSTPGQEYIFLRKDGSRFIGLIYASPIIQRNNTIGIRGAIIDITERKHAEEALRESEERLRHLYQESPIPTFTWQKKGDDFILIDFNRAAIEITNGKVGAHLGESAGELYKDSPQILDDMNLCFQERSFVKREVVSRHFAPGRHLSVHYGFIPPDLIIVHTDDQTDRKQAEESLRRSEEKFAKAFQASPIIVLISSISQWEIDRSK